MKKFTLGVLWLTLLFLSVWPSDSEAADIPVRLKKGSLSTTITRTIVKDDLDMLRVGADKGQLMTVTLTSKKNNAAMQIFTPGTKLIGKPMEIPIFSGSTLPGTTEKLKATKWSGKLPAEGMYFVVIKPTSGSTEYSVQITFSKMGENPK